MNKLKRLFVTMVALVLSCACMLSLTACSGENIVEAKFNIGIYNYTEQEMDDFTLDIDLYGHLAPKTVEAISKYINGGYYNGTFFYKMADYSNQYMIGDLKYDPNQTENEGFSLNTKMVTPAIEGEFEHGGTIGSNLKHTKGSIGLWRTWSASDVSYSMGRTGTDSGKSTLFMPTTDMQAYNKFFCVFATYDVNDSEELLLALTSAFDDYEEFVIYYTGEYGENGEGLTFNCVKKANFYEDEIEDLFKAETGSEQLVCYNHYTIKVPMTNDGQVAAMINSAHTK